MESSYCGTSTQSNEDIGPLTFEKLKESLDLMEKGPRNPFVVFSWAVPYDQAYHGPEVDKMIKARYPNFNPKYAKGYLLSKRYEGDVEILSKNAKLESLMKETI